MQCLICLWLVGGKERESRSVSGGDEIERRRSNPEGGGGEIERR